ncbi:MAG TPA: class I SAM-dependent methyltransferase [Mesorhizobium sp.]|nr:class I SAM-dependent methyltransferase [Mesorhizobium sp.]
MTAPALQETAVDVLRQWASGETPAGIAQMRLIVLTPADAEPEPFLAAAVAARAKDAAEAEALAWLARQAASDTKAWARVRATAAAIPHDEAPSGSPAEEVERLAARFDAAARISPEASVALYSLGDPARLDAATAEIAGWLRDKDLLGQGKSVLDLGCGIGRMARALAPDVGRVVGCDISEEMVRVARTRSADLPNAEFRRTSGLDLAGFGDASFDLVLVVDVFPYLVAAGGDLAGRHVAEAARVLKPGGALAILNFSYRGTPERDAAELSAWAGRAGLKLVEGGTKPFQEWDGTAFRLVKP